MAVRVKTRTPEQKVWDAMKQRCCNPHNLRYVHYGGRGVTICDRWLHSSAAFCVDMGPRPGGVDANGRAYYSLDRIDNDGNYEPGNCRWATRSEQRATQRQLRKRRSTCSRGHLLTLETTYARSGGWRRCRICWNEYLRNYTAKAKAS